MQGRSSNHGGNDGGTQNGILNEDQRYIGVDTARNSRNSKGKHDTEGGGGGHRKTALKYVPRTMARRLLGPEKGVNNVTLWRGELIAGTTSANGAR